MFKGVPFDAVYGFQKDQVEDDNESKKRSNVPIVQSIVQQQQSLHQSIDRAKGEAIDAVELFLSSQSQQLSQC